MALNINVYLPPEVKKETGHYALVTTPEIRRRYPLHELYWLRNVACLRLLRADGTRKLVLPPMSADQKLRYSELCRNREKGLREMKEERKRIGEAKKAAKERKRKEAAKVFKSPTEALVFKHLVELGWKELQPHYKVFTATTAVIYDFYLPNLHALIELDSKTYHGSRYRKDRDSYKNRVAEREGFLLVRVKFDGKQNPLTIAKKVALRVQTEHAEAVKKRQKAS